MKSEKKQLNFYDELNHWKYLGFTNKLPLYKMTWKTDIYVQAFL